MNRRVEVERVDKQLDTSGSGEELTEYVRVATVWSDVRQLRGNESFSGMQRFAEVTHRFRMRYRKDVTPEYTLLYQDRRFDIVEVLEVGRLEGLDVLATARAE